MKIGLSSIVAMHWTRPKEHDSYHSGNLRPLAHSCTVGRIGLGARTVVFAVIGGSLLRAAWRQNEEEVRDLDGALAIIRDLDLLYLAVAGGLVVFGAYSAIEARYRIVPRIDPLGAGARASG